MIVDNITQGAGAHSLHRSYLDSKKKVESEHKASQGSNQVSSDKIEISEDAKLLMQQTSILKAASEALNSLPDVRADKVQQSTDRLQEGYYEDPQVYSKVADSLIGGPNEEDNAIAEAQKVTGEELEVRLEKIQEAQQKIEEGFYERQEIVENIVSRLLQ